MSHLFRSVYHSIVDFFVQKAEDSRYCCYQILKYYCLCIIVSAISELLKYVLISERKGVFLFIDMTLSIFLVVLKITHFLPIRQEAMSFFLSFS